MQRRIVQEGTIPGLVNFAPPILLVRLGGRHAPQALKRPAGRA